MLKIGLFATGLDTYWGQFDGLRDNLDVYRRTIVDCINSCGDDVECVDAGMVDSPEKALAAARYFNENILKWSSCMWQPTACPLLCCRLLKDLNAR